MAAAGRDANANDIAPLNRFFADLIQLALGLGRYQLDAFSFGRLLVRRAHIMVVSPSLLSVCRKLRTTKKKHG